MIGIPYLMSAMFLFVFEKRCVECESWSDNCIYIYMYLMHM